MRSTASFRSLSICLGGLIGAAGLLAGCGGGGGSGGSITSAGLLPPGSTFGKTVRVQLAGITAAECESLIRSAVTTVPTQDQTRTLRLRLHETSSQDSTVLREETRTVPPYTGEILITDISAGEHLIEVEALNSEGTAIFRTEQNVRFAPGEPAFIDFVASPVSTLRDTYAGGQLCPNAPFTYVLRNKGTPYRITDIILVPAAARLVIEPGVELRFENDAAQIQDGKPFVTDFLVEGRLTAVGTSTQSIVMTRNATGTVSQRPRILFRNDQADPIQSRLRFADIRFARTGVELQGSDVSVTADVFQGVGTGVLLGLSSTGRVVGNAFATSISAVQATTGSATDISRNTVQSGQFGIVLQNAGACLVENNTIQNVTSTGLFVQNSSLAILNNNTVRQLAGRMQNGIVVSGSNSLLTQNRVLGSTPTFNASGFPTSGMLVGVNIANSVSGSANSDRLVLDHNTVQRAIVANVVVSGADPVLRFNEISQSPGASAAGTGLGISIDGLSSILPKQPLLLGNNIRSNAAAAVGPLQQTTGAGGGVLGSTAPGGANYVADNAGAQGADLTARGAVDSNFDVSTQQILSVDAILSTTGAPVSGAGAPATTAP